GVGGGEEGREQDRERGGTGPRQRLGDAELDDGPDEVAGTGDDRVRRWRRRRGLHGVEPPRRWWRLVLGQGHGHGAGAHLSGPPRRTRRGVRTRPPPARPRSARGTAAGSGRDPVPPRRPPDPTGPPPNAPVCTRARDART